MTDDPNAVVDPGTLFSLVGLLYVLLAVVAAVHVLLNKENEGAAVSWLGVIILSPFFGALLYWLFGINRIRRRVAEDRAEYVGSNEVSGIVDQDILSTLSVGSRDRMHTGHAIHPARYCSGNSVSALINGDQAYPRMLEAIGQANTSIVLSSYIFECDAAGRDFVKALVDASNRGVLVRVLIDGLGIGYGLSLKRSDKELKKNGVKTARFLSTFSRRGTRFINLRNHRKILVVDGETGFMGGINIRAGNLLKTAKRRNATADVHFEVHGPVVEQIQSVFIDDWEFATGEKLDLPTSNSSTDGPVVARVLVDGPDNNHHKLQLTLLAAINSAQKQIRIATPYFVPDKSIQRALELAALKGVQVQLLVPQENNLKIVDWAMKANTHRLEEHGVKIYQSLPPFDHSKLFIVDNEWCLVGSSNWDARSLELNFEINLECYDTKFTAKINQLFEDKLEQSVVYSDQSNASLLLRLRNNFFRLFSPYL